MTSFLIYETTLTLYQEMMTFGSHHVHGQTQQVSMSVSYLVILSLALKMQQLIRSSDLVVDQVDQIDKLLNVSDKWLRYAII